MTKITEEELMYWWKQYPELDKEEVREIVELYEEMYHESNNEAS